MSSEITVTEHLLLQQQRAPQATGHFTALFHDLVLSAKIIARSVNKAGLLDVLGGTGDINVQGENVQKLDDFANRVLLYRMERSGVLCAIASEENAELVRVSAAFPRGDYMLVFDPLDGSSNIDVNINVGTIFSILRRKPGRTGEVQLDEILQPGSEQVAAGYFLYGTSTMLVYTTGQGVHGFTLDPSVGEFLLSHPDIRIPETGASIRSMRATGITGTTRPEPRSTTSSILTIRMRLPVPRGTSAHWLPTSIVRSCTAACTCIRRTAARERAVESAVPVRSLSVGFCGGKRWWRRDRRPQPYPGHHADHAA